MASLVDQIQGRRLVLTAEELRQLTGWPDQVIEDYLAAIETILEIADSLDDNNTGNDELESQIGISQVIRRLDDIESMISQRKREPDLEHDCQVASRMIDNEPSTVNPGRLTRLTVDAFSFSELLTDGLVVNTNTPAGATAYQLAVKDKSGTILGYIPLYGSAW